MEFFGSFYYFWVLSVCSWFERPNGKPTDMECQLCSPSNNTPASRDLIKASGHPLLDSAGKSQKSSTLQRRNPNPKRLRELLEPICWQRLDVVCPSVFEEVVRITTLLTQIFTARWQWGWEGDSEWEISLTIDEAEDNLTTDFAILTYNQIPSSTRYLQSKCVWKREVATGDAGPWMMASSCVPSFIWI